MKNLWEEEDFCKIFAFAEENKLPFLQGWEFLQREELEQDSGPGQKVSQEKEAKGWGQSAKLGKHSVIWGKLGTALQAYTLNPCTKFPPNPTSRKVNT